MSNQYENDELEYIDFDKPASSKEKKPKYNKTALIACVVFVLVGMVSGTVFLVQRTNTSRAQKEMEQLAQNTLVETVTQEPLPTVEEKEIVETQSEPELTAIEKLQEMGVPIPDKTVDFTDLQANTNEDIYAWVYIPDSKIDYPILQHPEDNYYYLNYNLDGSKGYPGCIYTEDYNAKDFTDPNTVIYGHNMKNGSMFAGLHNYEDITYFNENPYVYIYTPDELLVYKIFAAYEYSDEHLLYNHDFTDAVEFQIYLSEIFETRSMTCNLREDVEVTAEDKIITLSTCIATKPNNRYLVQGVLLNED